MSTMSARHGKIPSFGVTLNKFWFCTFFLLKICTIHAENGILHTKTESYSNRICRNGILQNEITQKIESCTPKLNHAENVIPHTKTESRRKWNTHFNTESCRKCKRLWTSHGRIQKGNVSDEDDDWPRRNTRHATEYVIGRRWTSDVGKTFLFPFLIWKSRSFPGYFKKNNILSIYQSYTIPSRFKRTTTTVSRLWWRSTTLTITIGWWWNSPFLWWLMVNDDDAGLDRMRRSLFGMILLLKIRV